MSENLRRQALFGLILLLISITTLFSLKALKPANENSVTLKVKVKNGDSLWKIARRYSSGQEDLQKVVFKIKEINSKDSNLIYPGETILVPCETEKKQKLSKK